MLPGANFGKATRVTASGITAITSANAYIIGVMFNGSGTGACQLFAGLTATATAASGSGGAILSGVIRAYNTVAGATVVQSFYQDFPAYASGGIVINLPSTSDPDVTLFWNPAGGA